VYVFLAHLGVIKMSTVFGVFDLKGCFCLRALCEFIVDLVLCEHML